MRVAIVLLLVVAVAVHATFASSSGFSGRNADCTVCHSPGPWNAQAYLEGLPETWMPGTTYALSFGVEGGPTPLLPERPQGGFELEAERGTLAPAPGTEALFRSPRADLLTYEPEGTQQRQWEAHWIAPPATRPPEPVTFWLAAMAANGNHDPFLNRTDGGETGDAVATLARTVEPHPDTVAAWNALPLEPPRIDHQEPRGEGWWLEGRHMDANATTLVVVHGGQEARHETGPTWRIQAPDLDITLRAEGHGRTSSDVTLAPVAHDAPAPLLPLALALMLLATRFKYRAG